MRHAPLPFVFLLAMAADASQGASANLIDPIKSLELGSLTPLLKVDGRSTPLLPTERKAVEGNAQPKIVQFPNFANFRNCHVGTWRNC